MKTMAGRTSCNMRLSCLGEVQGRDQEVDGLDADEWNEDAAKPVDQEIAAEQRAGADRPISEGLKRHRDERNDDQRIEDDRREDRALRGCEMHHVQRPELRIE